MTQAPPAQAPKIGLRIKPPPCPSCGSTQCNTRDEITTERPTMWACRTCGQSFEAELSWSTPKHKRPGAAAAGAPQAGATPDAPTTPEAPPARPAMYLDAGGPTFADKRFQWTPPPEAELGGLFLTDPAAACRMLVKVLETTSPVHAHPRGERVKGCPVCNVLEKAVGK